MLWQLDFYGRESFYGNGFIGLINGYFFQTMAHIYLWHIGIFISKFLYTVFKNNMGVKKKSSVDKYYVFW